MTSLRVVIDTDACTGHGRCYTIAPYLFGDDDEGRGFVRHERWPGEHRDVAAEAARSCPEQAIHVQEDQSA